MVRVVLDTNVLLVSISPNAPNHWIIEHFINEHFILCVTTDILPETPGFSLVRISISGY